MAAGGTIALGAVREEAQQLGPWRISTRQHHMLPSRCHANPACVVAAEGCDYCRATGALPFPLPEEVYTNNTLRLTHASGATIEVCAILRSPEGQVQGALPCGSQRVGFAD
jgi:hypothetical protein